MIQDSFVQSPKQILGIKEIHQQAVLGNYRHILQLRLIKKLILMSDEDPQLKSSAPRLLLDFIDGRKMKIRAFIFGKYVFRWLKYLKEGTIYKVFNYGLQRSEFIMQKLHGAYQYCLIVTSQTQFFRCPKANYHPSSLDTIVSLGAISQASMGKQFDITGVLEQIGRMFYEGGKMAGKILLYNLKSKRRAELTIFDKNQVEQLRQGRQYILQNVVFTGQKQQMLIFHASPFCKISQVQHNFYKKIQGSSESEECQIMSPQMQLILENQFLNIRKPMEPLNLISSFSSRRQQKVQLVDEFCLYQCQFCGIKIKKRFENLRSKVQKCKLDVARLVLKHYFRYHLQNLQKIYHLIQEKQSDEQSNLESEETVHIQICREDVKKVIFSGSFQTILLYDSFSFSPQFYKKMNELQIQNNRTLILQITEYNEDLKPQNSYVEVDSQIQCNNLINEIVTSFLLFGSQCEVTVKQIIIFSNEIQVLFSSTEALLQKKVKHGESTRKVKLVRQKVFNKKRLGKTKTEFLDEFELSQEQLKKSQQERTFRLEEIYLEMNYFI